MAPLPAHPLWHMEQQFQPGDAGTCVQRLARTR